MAGLGLECNITSVAEYHVTSDQLLSKKQADSRSFQPRYHDIIEDISDIKNWFHSDSRSPTKSRNLFTKKGWTSHIQRPRVPRAGKCHCRHRKNPWPSSKKRPRRFNALRKVHLVAMWSGGTSGANPVVRDPRWELLGGSSHGSSVSDR